MAAAEDQGNAGERLTGQEEVGGPSRFKVVVECQEQPPIIDAKPRTSQDIVKTVPRLCNVIPLSGLLCHPNLLFRAKPNTTPLVRGIPVS